MAKKTAPIITMTDMKLRDEWDALFTEHPWLDGLTSHDECGNIFCCPPHNIPDWNALHQAGSLLFLAGGDITTHTLTHRSLHDALTAEQAESR